MITRPIAPPIAPRRPHVRVLHGHEVPDDYAWMVHGGEELTAHLRAERDHYDAATAALEPLHRRLFTEMVARTAPTEEGAPHRIGDFEYRDVLDEGAQLGAFQRRGNGTEQWDVLLDLDAEAAAAGSTYAELGVREVGPGGALLAWSLDVTGEEVYELRFRDLATGRDLLERIARTYYSGAWSADGQHFFYTVQDHVHRPHEVWRHRIGTDPSADVLVLAEGDRRFDLTVRATRCGRWVLVHAESRDTAEVWAIPADRPETQPVSLGGRLAGHEYTIESVPGGPAGFLAVTNLAADEFTLRWLDLGQDDPGTWTDGLHERYLGQPITGVEAFSGHVVVSLRRDAQPMLVLVPVADDGLRWDDVREVEAPQGCSLELGINEVFDAPAVTVVEQSRIDPPTWWDVPFDGSERRARHRKEVPNHDPGAYVVSRRWVRARDGERVPVTVVAHRVTPLDGTAPCLLYGYGAYEHVVEQTFSRALPSLLDRGVVYAHAHVRGGGELGRRWWDGARMATKDTSFRDFVDVARALGTGPGAIVDGSRIVSRGGSAGGLLVAAAMDLDPEVFAGVVAEVPFVDVVNSMADAELPLTVGEWEEWGNPAVPEQYEWLAGYAPYENIPAPGRRPFLLVTGAVHDPRVLVHEPAKWVARLRATDPAHGAVGRPGQRGGILFRVALAEGSHGGAAARYVALDEQAQTQALILATMGIDG